MKAIVLKTVAQSSKKPLLCYFSLTLIISLPIGSLAQKPQKTDDGLQNNLISGFECDENTGLCVVPQGQPNAGKVAVFNNGTIEYIDRQNAQLISNGRADGYIQVEVTLKDGTQSVANLSRFNYPEEEYGNVPVLGFDKTGKSIALTNEQAVAVRDGRSDDFIKKGDTIYAKDTPFDYSGDKPFFYKDNETAEQLRIRRNAELGIDPKITEKKERERLSDEVRDFKANAAAQNEATAIAQRSESNAEKSAREAANSAQDARIAALQGRSPESPPTMTSDEVKARQELNGKISAAEKSAAKANSDLANANTELSDLNKIRMQRTAEGKDTAEVSKLIADKKYNISRLETEKNSLDGELAKLLGEKKALDDQEAARRADTQQQINDGNRLIDNLQSEAEKTYQAQNTKAEEEVTGRMSKEYGGKGDTGADRKCRQTRKLYGAGNHVNCSESLSAAQNWDIAGQGAELVGGAYQTIATSRDANKALESRTQSETIKAQAKAAERASTLQYGLAAVRGISAFFKNQWAGDHQDQAEETISGTNESSANSGLINRTDEITKVESDPLSTINVNESAGNGKSSNHSGYIVGDFAKNDKANPLAAAAVKNFDLNNDSNVMTPCLDKKKKWSQLEITRQNARAYSAFLAQEVDTAKADYAKCIQDRGTQYAARRKSIIKAVGEKGEAVASENDRVAEDLNKGAITDIFKGLTAAIQGYGQQETAKQLREAADNLKAAESNGVIKVGDGDDLPPGDDLDSPFRQGSPLPSDSSLSAALEETDNGENDDPPGFNPTANQNDPVAPAPGARRVNSGQAQSPGLSGGGGGGRGGSLSGELSRTEQAKAEYNNLGSGFGGYSSTGGGARSGDNGAGGRDRNGIDLAAMFATLMGNKEEKKDEVQMKFGSTIEPSRDIAQNWNGLQGSGVHIFHQVHAAYQNKASLREVGR